MNEYAQRNSQFLYAMLANIIHSKFITKNVKE